MRNLKKLRTLANRSQYWLSSKTGIQRSRISALENGHLTATEEEQTVIAKALETAMRQNLSEYSRLSQGQSAPAA